LKALAIALVIAFLFRVSVAKPLFIIPIGSSLRRRSPRRAGRIRGPRGNRAGIR
jgi:hypothetical protein